jgi:hypothetical protein
MLTGTLALTASCLAFASESASCFVKDAWITFCSWPLPPQPDLQLELPLDCVGVAVWVVVLSFDAVESAVFVAVWFAWLEPLFTSPPAMLTGTFALTAFCLAFAFESASCFVKDAWITFCSWPLPPTPLPPHLQSDPSFEPPTGWVGVAVWLVVLLLVAEEVPVFVNVWLAELGPLETLPPAMLTGTLALTAFWSAFASELASCFVPDS